MPAQGLFDELSTYPKVTVDNLFFLARIHYKNAPISVLNDCLLHTVRIYKRTSVFQHESIVFTLESGSNTE